MKNKFLHSYGSRVISALLAMGMLSFYACKPEREIDPVHTGSGQTTSTQTPPTTGQTPSTGGEDVIPNLNNGQTSGVPLELCRNQTGVTLQNQYTDVSSNTNSEYEDCYNSTGQLVYQGNAQAGSCYDELTSKFGSNLIYQAQVLFPNLYNRCIQSSGNQVQCLNDGLKEQGCAQLN